MEEIKGYIEEFCREFGKDKEQILNSKFFCLVPNTKTPTSSCTRIISREYGQRRFFEDEL